MSTLIFILFSSKGRKDEAWETLTNWRYFPSLPPEWTCPHLLPSSTHYTPLGLATHLRLPGALTRRTKECPGNLPKSNDPTETEERWTATTVTSLSLNYLQIWCLLISLLQLTKASPSECCTVRHTPVIVSSEFLNKARTAGAARVFTDPVINVRLGFWRERDNSKTQA